MTTRDEMTKAQRLELAAIEAPILRNASEKTLARRVALVDKDGKVTGYTSGREVLKGLAKAADLEHAVEGRARTSFCKHCGNAIRLPSAYHGGTPTICKLKGGCFRQSRCDGDDCNKVPSTHAFSVQQIRSRKGAPWRCASCALKASDALRESRPVWTDSMRSDHAKKAKLTRSKQGPERRAEISRKSNAAQTPAQRSARQRAGWETRRAALRATTPSPPTQGNQ